MRNLLVILTTFLILTASVFAQDHDSVKFTVAFQNLNVANQNLPGGDLSLDFKLANFGKWRLGVVGDFAYHRDTGLNPLGIPSVARLDRFQFLGGPQISYTAGEDRLSIFGRGLFGVTRFDNRMVALQDFARMTVSVGGGLDVHFGRVFIRPLQFDFQWIDERPVRYTRLGAGGGFRF